MSLVRGGAKRAFYTLAHRIRNGTVQDRCTKIPTTTSPVRDSCVARAHMWVATCLDPNKNAKNGAGADGVCGLQLESVSYTHLTLPTICSV
eukprot:9077455-Alexandrium_andersonii.AAC.1